MASVLAVLLVRSCTGELWGSLRRWGFRRARRHIGDRGSGTGPTHPRCAQCLSVCCEKG